MIQIGRTHSLEVTKITDFGVFLDAGEYGSALLPNRFCPEDVAVGDRVDAFIYFDSDNEIVATTEKPIAEVGEWGLMKIEGVNSTGAFASWGIKSKDLLIPFSEQRTRFREGQSVLVYVYTDKASGRIVGTTKFNKLLNKTPASYKRNEQVDLIMLSAVILGLKRL